MHWNGPSVPWVRIPESDASATLRRGTAAEAGLDEARLEVAWHLLERWAQDGSVPGSAIVVARRGVLLESRAFGVAAHGDQQQSMAHDSLFLVASVTKPVTAIAVLQLVERGLLSLADPVHAHIPEFTGVIQGLDRDRIRVEHLLTHTSGLPDMLPQNEALRARHAPLADFVKDVCRCELLFAAGTQVSYQSMGTLLAGEIVERITGQPLRQVMADHIFAPLAMASTSLGIRADLASRAADVVLPQEQIGTDYHWNTSYWQCLGAPWGGMFSTVDDLTRLLWATLSGGVLQDGRVLGTLTNRVMISDRTTRMSGLASEHRPQCWGLGWRLGAWGDLASAESFSHGGATGTLVGADPESGLACAIFTTRPGAPLHRVATAVQAAVIN